VRYDDYMDPIALARLLGRTGGLAAALTSAFPGVAPAFARHGCQVMTRRGADRPVMRKGLSAPRDLPGAARQGGSPRARDRATGAGPAPDGTGARQTLRPVTRVPETLNGILTVCPR
jgi:hypothetical protein